MKKWKWILPLTSLVLVSSLSTGIYFAVKKHQEQKQKEEKVRQETIKEREKIFLAAFNKYQEIKNKDIMSEIKAKIIIPFNSKIQEKVESFWEENYAKLQNKDLRNFYLKWKNKLLEEFTLRTNYEKETLSFSWNNYNLKMLQSLFEKIDNSSTTLKEKLIRENAEKSLINPYLINSAIPLFMEINFNSYFYKPGQNHFIDYSNDLNLKKRNISIETNNRSEWISPKKQELTILYQEFNSAFEEFKKDAWIVANQEDLVDTSNWTLEQIPDFWEHEYYSRLDYAFKKLRELSLIEMNKEIIIEDNQLTEEERNILYAKINAKKQKYLSLLKNILGSIVSKKWDLEKTVKAIAKYLVIKTDYVKGNNNIFNMTFLSLENEIAHFNCQAYSEFTYMSLNLLGYRNLGFESRYYDKKTKEWVPHVNDTYLIDGKTFIIDVTFADKYYTNELNEAVSLSTIVSINNKINEEINKAVLVPVNDYLNRYSIYIGKDTSDNTEIHIS
ncbi:hypothetical protein [Mycoplasmopsis glycophila]|uniref:Transglutaminase-like domain-containing protein n=2 Tax=Mycoplasmopsis glycophila TaxID=171285 RepID=A0A449AVQ4_9BACT|nr:hypothetical protein [Mycoplasmopsis glycophila]VEU70638.1 Uncharacterised protein [Mycoplasmopsis glycophila]